MISKRRIHIVRLLLTQEERVKLARLAQSHTGGNMSEYVRRQVFASKKDKQTEQAEATNEQVQA
jgi:hypothetical protein